jgi:hypothetical protein
VPILRSAKFIQGLDVKKELMNPQVGDWWDTIKTVNPIGCIPRSLRLDND